MESLASDLDPLRDEDVIGGVGIRIDEMRSVAHRQLVGSVAVAILILALTGLAALHPGGRNVEYAIVAHRDVQQPTFVRPSDHLAATIKRKTETP